MIMFQRDVIPCANLLSEAYLLRAQMMETKEWEKGTNALCASRDASFRCNEQMELLAGIFQFDQCLRGL